ncbi:gamma-secretase subunit PEN-2 [Hydra vulgaris]|uniref:Gamma-secretase subunit PEN-2 n=1 Tax=Hydra vulgaris TaxID=6087 RepID=T2M4N7_HYDVU|nr:gamma-secretase subunit PEN-2-like [Hydra vulgaris]
MDLKKVKDEEKVRLSRIYMYGGFVFLPFLWFINTVWFFRDAFCKEEFEGQSLIRRSVIISAMGAVIWSIGISVWVVMYQVNRANWEEIGDKLSFLIPLGQP